MKRKKKEKIDPETPTMGHQYPDKLTKVSLQIKETIVDLLQIFVPPSVTAGLDYEGLTLDNTNYISPSLKAFNSDIVYRTTCGATNVYITVLVEHKTRMELYPHLQILDYEGGIWRHDTANAQPLSVVIPIVIYQNERSYTKKEFHEYFVNLPPHLKRFVPKMDYILINVSKISDKKIFNLKGNSILRSLLLAYKHASDNEFVKKHFMEFFRFFDDNPHKEYYFQQMLVYLNNYAEISPAEMMQLVKQYFNPVLKEKAMSTYEQFVLQGKVEGKVEGKIEGKIEADLRTAKRLLAKGFTIVQIADCMDLSIEETKKNVEKIHQEENIAKTQTASSKK